MDTFSSTDTALIVAMVAAYILFTAWLTVRLRSRTNAQFMPAARALPASVVGILLMSEFVGAKSTVGTAQEAFGTDHSDLCVRLNSMALDGSRLGRAASDRQTRVLREGDLTQATSLAGP